MNQSKLHQMVQDEYSGNFSVFDEWNFTNDTQLGLYVQHVSTNTDLFLVAIRTGEGLTILHEGYSATTAYGVAKAINRFVSSIQQSCME